MSKLIRSFGYAFQGIFFALRNERNMRIHVCCMLYMFFFLGFFDFFVLSRAELATLLLANALVLAGELFNTAIEATIDLLQKTRSREGKIAKDTAAAAVLVAVLFDIALGIVLLWQPEAFRTLFAYFKSHPFALLAFGISLALAALFIFVPKGEKEPKA